MEGLQTVIQRLSVPSFNINVEIIQEVLIATKKASIENEKYEEFDIILEMLWDHLNTGLEEFDDQLLCSTCFYNVLSKSTKQDFYLNQILIIINDELEIKKKNHENISLATTLCYGLFQSSYLTNDFTNTAVLENTMKSIFKLLVRISYEYTQYTFIAFKTMSSFKKVIGTPLEMTIFSNENKIKILHAINNNWENPITGIRNLNRILFQTLLQVIDDDMLSQIIKEINTFYWNKAKYLMLTEVILKYSGNVEDYVLKNKWLRGLLNSLYKPGLVSAGADMYYAILEKLNSENCWITLFLEPVINLLKGTSFQAIENFKNYWCLNTFKKFPTLANDLVQHLKLASDSELKLYSILCVLKQANKLALIERKWTTATHNTNEQLFAYREIDCGSYSKENIVKSIIEGKQLHAYLGILFVIFDTSLKTGSKIPIDYESIKKLVDILEIISKQFAWEEDTLTSSDFSKMNDMVQTLINNSEYAEENNQDQTKISGFHQIVLNCLWLNVKAACDLASLLILYCKEYVAVCEKCLHIIMLVLETSRHKGAIEAAGAALGQGINYLTSTKLPPEVSQLPFILLKKKLNELLYETAKMSSVTRRGAGLSIMVHRIVSNDRKKGKPLFHYFMGELLTTCKTLDQNCEVEESDKDLPKAIYIHFLTRIVTDSSLASDIMYYSADLAELAFDNLTNTNWQIRNAALQLYGALIPKLIGQKKASGMDEETVATVACDEFLTHSPKLWKYIIKEINNNESNDIIQTHSNLVPILNVLANIARRYNFSCDLKGQSNLELDLLNNLTSLLGSPIYTKITFMVV
ncbi:unnamed protein product [Danaus chrysippus]|uniref:(African queen) hypothetical protein n=1 Tax=Danaus chrysippus TaxID=151541 RepID=A0A8J2W6P4_9NEOP|nr:unnamed protein product [Danaus chrysippus]